MPSEQIRYRGFRMTGFVPCLDSDDSRILFPGEKPETDIFTSMRNSWKGILALLLSHWFLYVPDWLMTGWRTQGAFWKGMFASTYDGPFSWLFLNYLHHPFRFSADWFLACVFWLYVKPVRRFRLTDLLAFLYFLYLLHQVYVAFYRVLYGEFPYYAYDAVLVGKVLPVFLASNRIHPLLFFSAAVLVLALAYLLVRRLSLRILREMEQVSDQQVFRTFLLLCGAYLLGGLVLYHHLPSDDFRPQVQWISARIWKSACPPRQEVFTRLAEQDPYRAYDSCNLVRKPDVYMLFIEAYGAMAYLCDSTESQFAGMARSMEQRLREGGWHCASRYSRSPIIGGRSWLAFTSTLSGLTLNNQPDYEHLLATFRDYPHMPRWFDRQGYHTYRLTTLQNNARVDQLMSRESMNAFWQFDDWYFYSDLPYQGYRYDEFGGIPDQYALGFLQDKIRQDSLPAFSFFITLNSHVPWWPPPPLYSDWRQLDTLKESPYGKEKNLEDIMIRRYARTIAYELEVLEDLVLKSGDRESIFIVIGDHQPPFLDGYLYGKYDSYATPVHIIARDSSLVRRFLDDGFVPGMLPRPDKRIDVTHAGLYSILMKRFLEEYGSCRVEPPYLRGGIP